MIKVRTTGATIKQIFLSQLLFIWSFDWLPWQNGSVRRLAHIVFPQHK